MNVIKRNGAEVSFDSEKILNAILSVNNDCEGYDVVDNGIAKMVTDNVCLKCKEFGKPIQVEEIQDLVEKELMLAGKYEAAKQYILYRFRRSQARQNKILTEKLTASNVQNQNANVDEASFGGRLGEAASFVTKQYALEHLMSKMAVRNHLNNEIYTHDLDSYAIGSHNCLSIPFDKLLAEGFNTRQTDVRPAGSINTAMQLVAVIFQLQSLQQFGGVSATHLDWTMVPYVRLSFFKHYVDGLKYICEMSATDFNFTKEELRNKSITDPAFLRTCVTKAYDYAMDKTKQELAQSVEGLYHNLNTLQSRSGNQLPFTSINFGTCTLEEGRMITEALLEGCIKGCGKFHKTSIFPCGIFQCMKGVNRKPGDPNYDLFRIALKSTAQRIYPNYANCDWSGNAGYDPENPCTYFSTMGCRTANGWDINCEDEKLGQLKDGRGNICPISIILPTLAMHAKEAASNICKSNGCHYDGCDTNKNFKFCCVEEFMKILDKKIHEAKDQLIERFEWICSQSPSGAKFMYENGTMYGYKPEEGIRSALKHGTLAIGQLGLAECLQILIGCDHTDPNGMELAKKIEGLFKERCAEFKKEYSLNFGVYLTPAENLAYTAMTKFREKYGIIPNVSDKEFFTNSMHVPVWHKMTPFEKIDLESQLTGYSSAGCITYVELDSSAKNNIDAMEELVNYAMDKDIPYFAINVPIDTCQSCGYQDDISGDTCPKCGGKDIQRLRRVTGYITGDYTTAFNFGKQKEVNMRVKHNGIEA
jgi:ribonucleoside-triphosphate reductase